MAVEGYIAMPIIVLLLNSQLKGLTISIFLCLAPLFLIQVSSLTSSIHGHFSGSGKAGLILSSTSIAAVLFYILHDYKVSGIFLFMSFIFLSSSVLPRIISGIAAIKITRDKIVNKYKIMLILWCIPALWFNLFFMFPRPKRFAEFNRTICFVRSVGDTGCKNRTLAQCRGVFYALGCYRHDFAGYSIDRIDCKSQKK